MVSQRTRQSACRAVLGTARQPVCGQASRARTVFLLVDVINPLDFPGAEVLAPAALQAAPAVGLPGPGAPLLARRRCRGPAGAQRPRSADGDLTVLKPRHSAFHEAPLDLLLRHIGARQRVVTGCATDLCVQVSAMDAFVRGCRLWVPADTCAAESTAHHAAALAWMERALKCHVQV